MKNQKPLRIAVIVGRWLNYGVETLTLNIYRNIDKNRVQFDFIVDETPIGSVPVDEIESMGGRVITIPAYSRPFAYHESLIKLFREQQYLIVHAHISSLCFFPLWAAKKAGVPIRIAHCHTMAGKGEYVKNIMKYSLRLVSHTYPTHYATSSLMAGDWLFGPKIQTEDMYYLPVAREIHQFCYSKSCRDSMRESLGLEEKFVVGHLGRFVPQKNHEFLIEVFREVHKRSPESVLLLAGDGPLVKSVLNKVDSFGLEGAVHYLGRRNDASDLYQAMDVFVLPSLYEGVPGTGIEAQASGLPFIFSSTITDEASILPSAQRIDLGAGPRKWADAILASRGVVRSNTSQEMTLAGYNIKTAADNLACYYEELVGNLKR